MTINNGQKGVSCYLFEEGERLVTDECNSALINRIAENGFCWLWWDVKIVICAGNSYSWQSIQWVARLKLSQWRSGQTGVSMNHELNKDPCWWIVHNPGRFRAIKKPTQRVNWVSYRRYIWAGRVHHTRLIISRGIGGIGESHQWDTNIDILEEYHLFGYPCCHYTTSC